MKKISLILTMAFVLAFSLTAAADEEEFSSSANISYDYDEYYDETESPEETTSETSDDVKTSYKEDYDEYSTQDLTSDKYDETSKSYNKEFDERDTGTEIPYSQPDGITVILNGKKLEFDVEPIIINGRTMVPMRVIFEALGAKVNWDDAAQSAIGITKNTTVKITIEKDYLLKNDNIVILDSPAVIISGRTLVPVRAIAESLDCKVEWYSKTKTVEILI